MLFAFEKNPPHQPHLQVSSSPIPGIRKWPIAIRKEIMHDISRLLTSCYVTHKGKRFPKYHDKDVLI